MLAEDATAGTMNTASFLFILLQTKTTRLPIHISIAKLPPTRNGTAIAIGRGTNLAYFCGRTSRAILKTNANAKNPAESARQCLGNTEKPSTPRIAMFR